MEPLWFVSKDTTEDKAEQLQLDAAGLSPLAEIQFHKLLYEASLTAMQEEGWGGWGGGEDIEEDDKKLDQFTIFSCQIFKFSLLHIEL